MTIGNDNPESTARHATKSRDVAQTPFPAKSAHDEIFDEPTGVFPRRAQPQTLQQIPRPAISPVHTSVFDDVSEVSMRLPTAPGKAGGHAPPSLRGEPLPTKSADEENVPERRKPAGSRGTRARAETLREIPRHALADSKRDTRVAATRIPTSPGHRPPPAPPVHPAIARAAHVPPPLAEPIGESLASDSSVSLSMLAAMPVPTRPNGENSGILDVTDLAASASASAALTTVLEKPNESVDADAIAEAAATVAAFESPAEESARLFRETLKETPRADVLSESASKLRFAEEALELRSKELAASEFEDEEPAANRRNAGLWGAALLVVASACVAVAVFGLPDSLTPGGSAKVASAAASRAKTPAGTSDKLPNVATSPVNSVGAAMVGRATDTAKAEEIDGTDAVDVGTGAANAGAAAPVAAERDVQLALAASGSKAPLAKAEVEAVAKAPGKLVAAAAPEAAPIAKPSAKPDSEVSSHKTGARATTSARRSVRDASDDASQDGSEKDTATRTRSTRSRRVGADEEGDGAPSRSGGKALDLAGFAVGYAQGDTGCVGAGRAVSLSQGGQVFACFQMMHRGVDEDVRIVWRRNGEQRRRSVFQVASSPTQQAFRATLSLTNDDIGSWSVQLVGPKGQLLVSRMFEVEP